MKDHFCSVLYFFFVSSFLGTHILLGLFFSVILKWSRCAEDLYLLRNFEDF
jgi:hypothetical protein